MNHEKNQYKFEEGEIHVFRITGFIKIDEINESFFVLKNKFGGKHLLKSHYYKHYKLKVNQELKCKIDKINCSGKIYLEPENPIYKEGSIYNFDLVEIIDHINSVGKSERAALVKDKFDNQIICSIPNDIDLNERKTIKCIVLRIKKGQLFLSTSQGDLNNNQLKIGETYWFILDSIKKITNTQYYILKDDFDSYYSLRKDMYQHYNFKLKEKIKCFVTKYNTDGNLKIEPIHPYYKINNIYSFKVLRIDENIDPLGNKEKIIIVNDIYGIETKVRSINIDTNINKFDYIKCKVDGIRKGKAILSLL